MKTHLLLSFKCWVCCAVSFLAPVQPYIVSITKQFHFLPLADLTAPHIIILQHHNTVACSVNSRTLHNRRLSPYTYGTRTAWPWWCSQHGDCHPAATNCCCLCSLVLWFLRLPLHWSQNRHSTTVQTDSRQATLLFMSAATLKPMRLEGYLPTTADCLAPKKKWVCFESTVWPDTCCSVHRIRVLLQWTKRI